MTPFTYKVTHIPSGKWYYGVRYADNCHPSDLWKTYWTSSKPINYLIEQDGYKSFEIEIRQTFKTKNEAISWEAKVLRRILNWPNCLNQCAWPAISEEARARGNSYKGIVQSSGLTIYQQAGLKWREKQDEIEPISGLTYRQIRNNKFNATLDKNGTRTKSKEWKEWFSKNNPGSRLDIKEKISKTLKDGIASGRIKTTKGQKFQSISDKLKGNDHTKDMLWINDGDKDKRILNGPIPEGYKLGRLVSNNKGHKYEIKICPHCSHSGSGGNMKRYHFDNCKLNVYIL